MSDEYIKDLSILNVDLGSVIIMDNSVVSFCKQLDNGIYVRPFHGYKNDYELLDQIPFLSELANAPNVRAKIEERFGLLKLYEHYKQCY